jgi:hypothetical protein
LYAGVEFDPKHPPIAKYHMQSKDFVLGAKGPIDQGNPPFLGAPMVNDSTWTPPKETHVPPTSLANYEFNDNFTLAASRDTKTNQELLVTFRRKKMMTGSPLPNLVEE